MTSFRLKLFQIYHLRPLTGSAFSHVTKGILAVNPSTAAFDALCLCRQHVTSLTAVTSPTAVNNWLHHYNSSNIVRNKDGDIKSDDFFQTFRNIVNGKDLNFISLLESAGSDVHAFTTDFKKCDDVLNKLDTHRLKEAATCLNISSSTVKRTQNLQAKKSQEDVISSGNTDNVTKPEPVQFETSNTNNAGPDKNRSDSHLPTLEQLEIVREYYIRQTPELKLRGEDYTQHLHHRNLVFDNQFFRSPITTRGLLKYSLWLMGFRLYLVMACTKSRIDIVNIECLEKKGCVKMHWRLSRLSFLDILKKNMNILTTDGISTFYVNNQGKIVKHHLDRRTPLQTPEAEMDHAAKLAAKLAQGLAAKSPIV